MELRLVSDDGKTIVLEHDPLTDPDAIGFRLAPVVRGGKIVEGAWAHTWDASRTSHKFASGFGPYTVEALMRGEVGVYPPVAPPSTDTLDIYRYTIYPGPYITPYPGGENHAWYWLVFKQPTVETYFPTSANQADMANIRWAAADGASAALYAGRETWVVTSYRFLQGSPGRFLNFHQHVGADGTLCNTRIPPSSCGVSPVALDWYRGVQRDAAGGANGITVSLGPGEDNFTWPTTSTVVPDTEMAGLTNEWVDVVMRIRWGRYDETVKGAVTVWVNGVKRFDRDPAPSSFWKNERMVLLWQGGYWYTGVTEETVFEATPYRVGRTLEEALAQRPVLAGPGWGSKGQDGRNANAVKVGTRPVSEIQLP